MKIIVIQVVACNVKRWWQHWQGRWNRRQGLCKLVSKCFHIVRVQRKTRSISFHVISFFFFNFFFCSYVCNQLLFLPQAKVTVAINSCPPRLPLKKNEKTSDLNWVYVLCGKIQIEKQTMRDLIKRLLKKTARIKMVNHFWENRKLEWYNNNKMKRYNRW